MQFKKSLFIPFQELEEIRFYKNLLLKLTKDETRNEIKLPLTLNHEQQKKLHNYAKSIGGLEMESSDKGVLEHKI